MLPNLIVIGAAKSGTTSLHHCLGLHPEIEMAADKELRFFVKERNWDRGREWYEAQFRGDTPVRGESSPIYTGHPHYTGVPGRMAALIPDAKLIYILRDPFERMISDYASRIFYRDESQSFAEAIADFDRSYYVARSQYFFQLEQFLEHFPAEQIHVIDMDELASDPDTVVCRAFAFLGVDESFTSPGFRERRNPGKVHRIRNSRGERIATALERALGERWSARVRAAAPMAVHRPFSQLPPPPAFPPELHRELTGLLGADVSRLRAHTGLAFGGWSV